MRIADIIGTVTLSRVHPTLIGFRWLIGIPYSLKGLQENIADGEDLVMYDDMGAMVGCQVGFSEGGEAAAPFHPNKKPVDAYCACILDQLILTVQP